MGDGELGCDNGAERHVALLSKPVMHDVSITPDQNAGRRSLHPVSLHGDRDRHATSASSTPIGKVSRYSWMNAPSDTGVIAA